MEELIENQRDYDSNIYIEVPYYFLGDVDFNYSKGTDSISGEFIKLMKENSEYECNSDVVKNLKRSFLGKKQLYCFDDQYDELIKSKEECHLFLTVHESTKLAILTLMITKNKYSTTQIQDQISANVLYLNIENKKTLLDEYMKEVYNLERCGEAKVLVSLSKKPKDDLEFKCMLANESYVSAHSDYILNSDEINKIAQENFSQYDFYEIYATKACVLYILKNFTENELTNLENEIPILFIIELIMFQQAAILRTNKRIINELVNNDYVSLAHIEDLYTEFGKTTNFWVSDVFKYLSSQYLADKINRAFATDKLLGDYYKNQDFLEHIVTLRDVQNSNRESKILNIIVLVLTVLQVIPVVINLVELLKNPENVVYFYSFQFLGITSLLLIIIIILIKQSVNKKKKSKLK